MKRFLPETGHCAADGVGRNISAVTTVPDFPVESARKTHKKHVFPRA